MLKSFKTTLACKKKFGYDVTMDAMDEEKPKVLATACLFSLNTNYY